MELQDRTFWGADGRPGAQQHEIEAAENYVGFRLPDSLRALLREQNGGVSKYVAYENGTAYYPMMPIFSVDSQAAVGSIMRAFDVRESFGAPKDVVPFAGLGETWWGLDYRASSEHPSIVFRLDQEHDIETVAPSFDELLRALVEAPRANNW